MALTILVADDDPHIRDVIGFALEKAGHRPLLARDGEEAMTRFLAETPDLVILDVGMPELDGLEVCRRIRKGSDVPILFLSARDEEIDRILGLEIGGDDYVTKPFSPRELVTRIGVIMRRVGRVAEPQADAPPSLAKGDLSLDRDRHEASFAGTALTLTSTEFQILAAFLARPRHVFDRERLMKAAYPTNIHVSDRTIDSHVRNVRAKLSAAGCNSVIDTVHGVGFRLGSCERRQGA